MSGWGIVGTLVRASLEGGLFVAAVWTLCRLVPRLPAAVRCGLWWAACLKLLLGLIALPAVRLPLLPAVERAAPVAMAGTVYTRNVAPARTLTPGPSPFPSPPPSQGEGNKITVREVCVSSVIGLWLFGLLILSGKAIRQLRETRRIVRSAEPVREGWVRTAFAAICERLGLRRAPDLRGSGEVRTPQVTGLAQPVVLIPRAGLERMTPAEVSMTLCHELVHLRRKDLWLGWVPALAHRIFFFHPLAALAVREYAIAREAACDAEVLRILGTAPQAYGRLLLRWGVAPRETGLAAAGASPSLQNLKRRLQMLQQSSDNKRRMSGWWWLAGAAVLAGLVPLRIVGQERAPQAPVATPAPEAAEAPEAAAAPEAAEAAEADEAPEAVEASEATPAPEAVEAPAAPEAVPAVPPAPPRARIPGVPGGVKGGVRGGIPGGVKGGVRGGVEGAIADGVEGGVEGVPAVAPVTPRPPHSVATPRPVVAPRAVEVPGPTPRPAVAPAAPLPPGPTPRPGVAPRPMARLAFAPTPAPTPRAQGVPEPPPAPPAPPAPPRPPKPPKPPKHYGYSYHSGDHGDSYVLLYGDGDSATMSGSMDNLQKARRLRGNSKDGILWFQSGGKEYVVRDPALLKQARDLYKPVAELGARQGELGGRQGELGGKQGALGAKQGALGAELGTLAANRARRGDADDRDLERREKEIDRKMEELSRQMEDLGRQQEDLGKQQEELGRQQEEASARAEKQFHELLDKAIHSGAAQEVR